MTDTPDNALQTQFADTVVWLPDLARLHLLAGAHTLRNLTFTDCVIEGPAVLMVGMGTTFESCSFGAAGDGRNLLLRPVGENLTGVIALYSSRFERCRFVRIGFVGSDAFVEDVSRMKGRVADAADEKGPPA